MHFFLSPLNSPVGLCSFIQISCNSFHLWPSWRCVYLKSLHMMTFLLSSYHLKFLWDSSDTNEKFTLFPSSLIVLLCFPTFLAYFISILLNFLISKTSKRKRVHILSARFKAELWKHALNITRENTWKDTQSKYSTSLIIWEVQTKILL